MADRVNPEATVESTTCVIAGCGPAGAVLGLLLARAGVEVLVLEKHADFFRDFRGDTIHPSTLEVLEELGLFEAFDELPHRKTPTIEAWTDDGPVTVADFRGLDVRHRYIALVPQWDFLDLLTDAAKELPNFTLRMEAEVLEAVEHGRCVSGLRYRDGGGVHEVRAALTVAADGRSSALTRSAGLVPRRFGAPMDVLWFRIPREDSDPETSFGRVSAGRFLAMINRGDYWQAGYLIPKGSGEELRARSVDTLRATLAELLPFLADRVGEIRGWDDVFLLSVQIDRLRRWHRPGLLCLGDAAHAMSPIGGVGINLAVQDAVAAGNLLAAPLLRGTLREGDLARVARRRWLPTAATQAFQRLVGRRVIRPVLAGGGGGRTPLALRLLRTRPRLRRIPARLLGVGVLPEHVRVGALSPEPGTRAAGSPSL